MLLIEEIKLSLGVRSTSLDLEIESLILSAKSDLELIGIKKDKLIYIDDPLIKRAITLYVKGFFGWGNIDSEKSLLLYEKLKQHLSLSSIYIK